MKYTTQEVVALASELRGMEAGAELAVELINKHGNDDAYQLLLQEKTQGYKADEWNKKVSIRFELNHRIEQTFHQKDDNDSIRSMVIDWFSNDDFRREIVSKMDIGVATLIEDDDVDDYIDHCQDDMWKLFGELGIEMLNIPRHDVPRVYSKLCSAYRLITDVIDEYRK